MWSGNEDTDTSIRAGRETRNFFLKRDVVERGALDSTVHIPLGSERQLWPQVRKNENNILLIWTPAFSDCTYNKMLTMPLGPAASKWVEKRILWHFLWVKSGPLLSCRCVPANNHEVYRTPGYWAYAMQRYRPQDSELVRSDSFVTMPALITCLKNWVLIKWVPRFKSPKDGKCVRVCGRTSSIAADDDNCPLCPATVNSVSRATTYRPRIIMHSSCVYQHICIPVSIQPQEARNKSDMIRA